MPKRPMKLKIRIPEYKAPRNKWRHEIHKAVSEEKRIKQTYFKLNDRLEVTLRIYFKDERSAKPHDIDNRLKDCMDALQGRVGGTKTKKTRLRKPIVPNDRMIWRAVVEKAIAPKQADSRGHLTIRRLTKR